MQKRKNVIKYPFFPVKAQPPNNAVTAAVQELVSRDFLVLLYLIQLQQYKGITGS